MKNNFSEKIAPRAEMIMNLVLQGVRNKDIAERLNLSPGYVSVLINAPQFQHMLAVRRERKIEKFDEDLNKHEMEAAAILKEHAAASARKLVELADSPVDGIALKAAANILDRVGPAKQATNMDVTQNNIIIDEKAAMLIKETMEMDHKERKQIPSKEIVPDEKD